MAALGGSRSAFFASLLVATAVAIGTDGVAGVALVPYAATLGVPAVGLGLLFTTHRLVRIGVGPWLGLEADKRGRRPLLLVGVFSAALGMLGLAAAEGFAMLLVARVLYGLASALIITAGLASVLDVAGTEDRGGMIGFFQAALYGVQPVGTVLGGFLSDAVGYRNTFLVCGIFVLAGAFLALAAVRETRPTRDGSMTARPPPPRMRDFPKLIAPVWPYAALKMVSGFAIWGVFATTFALYMIEVGEAKALAGVLLALVSVLGFLVGSPLVGALSDRVGRREPLVVVSLVLTGLGMFALVAGGIAPIVLGVLALGIAVALASAPLATLVGERAPAESRAAVMAAYSATNDLANSAGSIVGASLALGIGYGPTYAGTALFVLVATVPLARACYAARR